MLHLSKARFGIPAALLCGFLAGCGGDNSHRVAGMVTFKGKPIPAGTIFFQPDGSKGNEGSTGMAEIKDGQFDTSAPGGRNPGSGPMIVQIEGFDPNLQAKTGKDETSGEEVAAKPLFPPYETTIDLPAEDSNQTIDVPADAAKQTDEPETTLGGP